MMSTNGVLPVTLMDMAGLAQDLSTRLTGDQQEVILSLLQRQREKFPTTICQLENLVKCVLKDLISQDADELEKRLIVEGLSPFFPGFDQDLLTLAILRAYRERDPEGTLEDLKARVRDVLAVAQRPD